MSETSLALRVEAPPSSFTMTIELAGAGAELLVSAALKHHNAADNSGPDRLILRIPITVNVKTEGGGGDFTGTNSLTVNTAFFAGTNGIFCFLCGQPIGLEATGEEGESDYGALRVAIQERNTRLGLKPPERAQQAALIDKRDNFVIQTSQEIDTFTRAACDGKRGAHYLSNVQARVITYERKELSHRVQLALTSDEIDAGLNLTHLEKLVRAQDSDAALAHLYIMSVLAPPPSLPPRAFAGGWIDFDDVIEKIGWYPQTTKDRRAMHARIWEFLRYGERAHIIGKRSGVYKDKTTGAEISTEIHGAAWRVMKTEQPAQASLYPALDVPVRAQIVMSQELTTLITAPQTAQYLPMGEVLGAIPGGKPAGAWARVIGLALGNFWRRNPRDGTIRPTRRELLDRYAAKVAPYEEVLAGNNPQRVIGYWCAALGILADSGFIAREGEVKRTAAQIRAALPRQGWADVWLDEAVSITPAGTMKSAIEARAAALPDHRPRDLRKPKRKTERSR